MADDLDAIERRRESRMFGVRGVLITVAERDALVADVRRLRAIEAAARAQVESERSHEHYPERYPETDPWEVCAFCEETWPCATARLRAAMEADRG